MPNLQLSDRQIQDVIEYLASVAGPARHWRRTGWSEVSLRWLWPPRSMCGGHPSIFSLTPAGLSRWAERTIRRHYVGWPTRCR